MATLFIGQNKVFLPETNSTNSYAITLLKNVNCIEGTVVYANSQTSGKGQRGNVWASEPSMNITLSLILLPTYLSAKKLFYLSKITSLALYDLLTECLSSGQFDIKIKWPNDMLVNNKKIAGVLIENSLQDDKINWSVIGVGLNVNQTNYSNLNTAISLKLADNEERDKDALMELFFSHFEKWYLKLKQSKLSEIDETYHKFLFGANKVLKFIKNNKEFLATILGVTNEGLIRLKMENGKEQQFNIAEISFVI